MRIRSLTRVLLHRLAQGHREEFLAATQRSLRFHRPWIDPPTTDAEFDGWLERQASDRFECFLIRRREDAAAVGICQLSEIIRGNFQSCFTGFAALAPHESRGYMTEGLNLVLREAFTGLRLHRVEANIQPDNAPSRALVKRLGFVREGFSERYLKVRGRWRDHERWAIRSELWRELHRAR